MKKVLTIAGSDPSGGAGIQADIKTITANGLYAMSVITALTAQNTLGIEGVYDINPEFIEKQMDSVFQDIFPDSIKIGMISNKESIRIIKYKLKKYKAKNIVLDPVMVSTSGSNLIKEDAYNELKKLIIISDIITPNIFEAEILSNIKITTKNDMIKAAKIISRFTSSYILIKGGHLRGDADDLLFKDDNYKWLSSKRINNLNTHGTGCTLSSAISCFLAKGEDVFNSVLKAKTYISGCIKDGLDIGKGQGPLNHAYLINKKEL